MEANDMAGRLLKMFPTKKDALTYAILRETEAEDSSDYKEQEFWKNVILQLK